MFFDNAKWNKLIEIIELDLPNLVSINSKGYSFYYPYSVLLDSFSFI